MPQPDDTSALALAPHSDSYSTSAEPSERHCSAALQPSWFESLLNHTEEEEEWSQGTLSEHTNLGMKRQLSDIESRSTDSPARCPDKKSRLDQEFFPQSEHRSSEHLGSDTVQVFGSFHSLQVLKPTPSVNSDLCREGRCTFFKTAIKEHSTVRTSVFPHGKTFTSHTPDGGCRFLWIPKQN